MRGVEKAVFSWKRRVAGTLDLIGSVSKELRPMAEGPRYCTLMYTRRVDAHQPLDASRLLDTLLIEGLCSESMFKIHPNH